MIPCRYILINQQQFKGVIGLEFEPINDVLELHIHVYQFKGQLTASIIQSFESNSSNQNFIKMLPIEMIASEKLSLNQAEQYFLYFSQLLQSVPNDMVNHTINIQTLTLYLPYQDIFRINNFINQFITTYEMVRMNLAVLVQKQAAPAVAHQADDNNETEIQNNEDIEVEVEDVENADEVTLLLECFKLSPNPLCSYYISKRISHILSKSQREKLCFDFEKTTVTIHLTPLINQELIEISRDNHSDLIHILKSFDFNQEEYISKLRLLVRQLIYIVTNYSNDNKTYFITLKIIEFLIMAYAIKLSPSSFLSSNSINVQSPAVFKQTVNSLVNYTVSYVLQHHVDTRTLKFDAVIFQHYNTVEYIDNNFDPIEVKQILSKELYLAEIDKDHFLNQVIKKVDARSKTIPANKFKLVFNKPIIFKIEDLLDGVGVKHRYLQYSLVEGQKQFVNHKILTQEYLQILQINNVPTISKTLLRNIHPILTKYANTIINQIFKELSSCDKEHAISTLHLLSHFIRPYLHEDCSIQTEFFILYRIVVPYLYDTRNIDSFYDYFH